MAWMQRNCQNTRSQVGKLTSPVALSKLPGLLQEAFSPLLMNAVYQVLTVEVLHFAGHRGTMQEDHAVTFEPGFYPGSGAAEEVGSGDGLGFTVNVALPSGFTDCCLWTACAQILLPAAKRFKPDLIIVSAGFDATAADPMGGALCSPRIFGHLTSELCALADSLCCGRLLIALEGGYEAQSLMQCVAEVTQALISSAAEVVGDVDGPGPFGSRPAWLKEPLAGSVSAILDTRAAHANLPLQLM